MKKPNLENIDFEIVWLIWALVVVVILAILGILRNEGKI